MTIKKIIYRLKILSCNFPITQTRSDGKILFLLNNIFFNVKTKFRALSDSSINQTVSSVPSPNSFNSNNFQLSYNQNYQQNDSQVYQNYQNVNFQLSFNEYDNQQSATNMNQMANGPQHKIFKNVRFLIFKKSTF